jgi:large subunit ribosomal protein L24
MKTLIRKNDTVIATGGRSLGKQGKVLEVVRGKGRALVEGLNMIKRHMRKSQLHPQGAIVEKEGPIHVSNLALFCPTCQRGVKLGVKRLAAGGRAKRIRFCRKCKHEFDK